ncbi:HpcH/HpaI aldolase/citrate lyase family protein [Leucobacter insecticola]|uniref:HpcH/HpaI aldolase/citrate lyase family protein n=1 Tax=Leucobacter insecticola TaxID=2714934 RepID=A0A6G8FIR5_9MICO|nr:HpcH/HpaI aldolase/citrate lyase family protein [Leucobacter insecticola]QIM16193.1 HpcH/HpaI aldolase/citrate lyase family protein [Leucobacter insecticola]
MPIHLNLPTTLRERLATAERPLIGLWACAGSPITAEIVAGSGCDWVLLDAEHSPNGLESVLGQLYAMSAYPVAPLVRPPYGDTVTIKQYLDLGAQNLLIPMVDSAEQAEQIVRAVRYPDGAGGGVRGVGSALARSARWNRVDGYLGRANETISLTVQIESAAAAAEVERILAVDGVDAIFVGPSDLAASMGYLGQQNHPEVVASVLHAITAATAAGKPVGVNAFVPADADRYIDAGASFVAVGADVAILARQTEALVDRFASRLDGAEGSGSEPRASY